MLAQQRLGIVDRDARERQARHRDLNPEGLADRLAVLGRDDTEDVRQPRLLEGHHVLVRVDPGDLDIDARELGVVA